MQMMQHVFVKGRSTYTNLLEAMNDWTLSVQNKNLAIANRSRVSCAHNMSRASPWPWNLG